MIKLYDNLISLQNLHNTIGELQNIDYLIEFYSVDKPGPAYTSFSYVNSKTVEVQIDRKIIVEALKAQRQKLVDYFASLGIDAIKGE